LKRALLDVNVLKGGGKFVTFHEAVPLSAVPGAEKAHLTVI
jgi:hypothetical protein